MDASTLSGIKQRHKPERISGEPCSFCLYGGSFGEPRLIDSLIVYPADYKLTGREQGHGHWTRPPVDAGEIQADATRLRQEAITLGSERPDLVYALDRAQADLARLTFSEGIDEAIVMANAAHLLMKARQEMLIADLDQPDEQQDV
jgi:hypothetical protein